MNTRIKTHMALDEFILSRQANGISKETIKWYTSILSSFADVNPYIDISRHDMRIYIVSLRERLAAASVRSHITALLAFYSFCVKEYDIKTPMTGIKRPKNLQVQPKAITTGDFMRLLEIANDRDKAILCFFADTGARLSGLIGLTTDDIDINRRSAIVTEKGNKTRKVYFTRFTSLIIRRWLQVRQSTSAYIFTRLVDGDPLKTSGITQILKRLKGRAGVKGRVNPHSFRHRFAREYVMNGGDIVTLAKILGHSDITTTAAYYAVFTDDELSELHDKYSPMKDIYSQLGESKNE